MTLSVSRRHLIEVAAGFLTAIGTGMPAAAADAPSGFAALRARWGIMLTGAGHYDPQTADILKYIAALDADAGKWRGVMTASPVPGGAIWDDAFSGQDVVNTRTSLDRLRLLAIAAATPGSQFFEDKRLIEDIQSALSFIAAERYALTIPQTGNWWEWQIGIPLALLDCILALDSQFNPDLVHRLMAVIDRFTPAPAMTAANLVWTAHIVLLRSLISESAAGADLAIRAIETTFADVTEGDGFHLDGSFVQHDEFAYTGGYGLSLLQRTVDVLYLLDGSRFALTPEAWHPVRKRVYTAFEPLMDRGGLADMVLGRGISRSYGQSHLIGRQVTAAVARLADICAEPEATDLRGMVKTWVSTDPLTSVFVYDPQLRISLHTIGLLRAIMAGPDAARPKPIANVQFPAMDRIVHSRPQFTFAISQSSKFIGSYESVNAENLHGWYTGSGMTYLHTEDAGHYQNDFWPTADMYRLPGTTVDTRQLADGQYAGLRGEAVVGGAAVDSEGVACMAFSQYDRSLTGKKAWFMFGDAILCAGTAIASTSDNPVETIVENRNVGAADTAFSRIKRGKTWRHVDGVGGYVFAPGSVVRSKTETRSGTWVGINKRPSSPTDVRTRNYVTIWLDHAARPQGAVYAYTLLPGATSQETRAWARRPAIDLIENSAFVQHAKSSQSEAAIFWKAGKSNSIASNEIACVLICHTLSQVTIGLSDPTEMGQTPITVTVALNVRSILSRDPSISGKISPDQVTLTFDPTDSKGQTRQIIFGT